VGSVVAAAVTVVAAAAGHAVAVVAVAPVVPQQYLAAASPVAIVRPARIRVRLECKKETRTCCSFYEQKSGCGRVRDHLMSERVLFGQVDSTADQLLPQKSKRQLQSGIRRIFEQAKR